MTMPVEIDVCTNCIMLASNGTLGAEDAVADAAHAQLIVAEWGHALIVSNSPDPDVDPDGGVHFSWQRCQGCGSTLGGDRHPAAVFVPEVMVKS